MFLINKCQHSKSLSNFSNSFSFEHSETNKCEKKEENTRKTRKVGSGASWCRIGQTQKASIWQVDTQGLAAGATICHENMTHTENYFLVSRNIKN